MDFIIHNGGLLLGILLIVLLAIIGYFADKKEKSSKENLNNIVDIDVEDNRPKTFAELPNANKNLNDVINNFSDLKANNIPDIGNENIQNNISNINISENSFSNLDNVDTISNSQNDINNLDNVVSLENIENLNNNVVSSISELVPNVETNSNINSDFMSFSSNNFENSNISLEDLEKKNFENIVLNTNSSDDENFYYSNLENDFSPESSISDVKDDENDLVTHAFDNEIYSENVFSDNISSDNVVSDSIYDNLNSDFSDENVSEQFDFLSDDSSVNLDNDKLQVDANNIELNSYDDNAVSENLVSNVQSNSDDEFKNASDSTLSDKSDEISNSNNFSFMNDIKFGSSQSVPELYGNFSDNNYVQSLNSNDIESDNDNQQIDDDVWKF